jgi:hypothetical protein
VQHEGRPADPGGHLRQVPGRHALEQLIARLQTRAAPRQDLAHKGVMGKLWGFPFLVYGTLSKPLARSI